MKQGVIKSFAFLILILSPTNSFSKNNLHQQITPVNHFTVDNGLSDNGVTFVFEDSKGYVWVGTYDGLNRYDGYTTKIYKNGLKNKFLSSNRIRSIAEDSNGNIWLGTDDGLTVYHYDQDRFEIIYNNSINDIEGTGPTIRQIIIDSLNNVFCITENVEIFVFNDRFELKIHDKFNIKHLQGLLCNSAEQLNSKEILIATKSGLYIYNKPKRQLKLFNQWEKYDTRSFAIGTGDTLYFSSGSTVLAYNYWKDYKGEYQFKKAGMMDIRIGTVSDWPYKIIAMDLDTSGKLWIGSNSKGVYVLNNPKTLFTMEKPELSRFGDEKTVIRVSDVAVNTIGGCWVGTYNKGVYRFPIHKTPFDHYFKGMNVPNAPETHALNYVSIANKNEAFILTSATVNNDGIRYLNPDTRKFKDKRLELPANASNIIVASHTDNNRIIWLGSNTAEDVFFQKKPGETEFRSLHYTDYGILNLPGVSRICSDNKDGVWFGMFKDLLKISLNSNGDIREIKSFKSLPFFQDIELKVSALYFDTLYSYLWVGTQTDGLFRIAVANLNSITDIPYTQYKVNESKENSISSNFITSIISLPDSSLWITSEGGGICKVINRNKDTKFAAISEEDGLSSNNTKAIQFDGENLWIASNKGLDRYNILTKQVKSFTESDGLKIHSFEPPSGILGNGLMIFGGSEGMLFFNPDDIVDSDAMPKINFRDFYMQNKRVNVGDSIGKKIVLEKQLSAINKLTLTHKQNAFAIEAVALHYNDPQTHKLRYRLTPNDQEWVTTTSDNNLLYYNGLQPGKYTLEAQASNASNNWTEPILLNIRIKPPWWKTLFMRIVELLLLMIIIYKVYVYRVKGFKENQQKLQSKIDESMAKIDSIKSEVQKSKDEVEAQKDQIRIRDIEEKEIRFTNAGIAKFSHIIGQYEQIDKLCQILISELVTFLDAQLGMIYIIDEDEQSPSLIVQGTYGFAIEQQSNLSVLVGEGEVGTSYQTNELIELTNVPDSYMKVSSGLGEVKPKYVCFIPICQDNNKIGVVELASFKTIDQYKINFIKQLGENISSRILLMRFNERNEVIIHETMQQAEELKAQEEEMRQNMEEMLATQEEIERVKEDHVNSLQQLQNELKIKDREIIKLKSTINPV